MRFVKAVTMFEEDFIVLEEKDVVLFVENLKESQKIFLKFFFNVENALDKKILFKEFTFKNFQEFFKSLFVRD